MGSVDLGSSDKKLPDFVSFSFIFIFFLRRCCLCFRARYRRFYSVRTIWEFISLDVSRALGSLLVQ